MEHTIEQTGLSHVDNAARNKNVILNIVRDRSPISRKEISQLSRLSIATTKRLIEELLTDRIIIEVGQTSNTRGRKASLLRLNEEYCCSIGVNVIHDAIEIAGISFTGTVLLTKKIQGAKSTRKAIQPLLENAIGEVIDELQDRRSGKLLGIGIGIAGLVDTNRGIVLFTPNMTGWVNVPLQKMLEARLGLPAPIEHDAKAAALGEFYFGAGRDSNDMIFIVVGTGVGAAIIINGQLYRGPTNSAGELGHITVDMNGPACSCGSNGCLEVFVAGPDLADRFREAAEAQNVALSAEIDGPLVAELAAQGQPQALQVFEKAGQALGVGISAPATCTASNASSGCPSFSQAARMASRPSLRPRPISPYKRSSVALKSLMFQPPPRCLRRRLKVDLISLRGTMVSTMPCSSRNSAR